MKNSKLQFKIQNLKARRGNPLASELKVGFLKSYLLSITLYADFHLAKIGNRLVSELSTLSVILQRAVAEQAQFHRAAVSTWVDGHCNYE